MASVIVILLSIIQTGQIDPNLTGAWIVRGPQGQTTLHFTGDRHYELDLTSDGHPEVAGILEATGDSGQVVFRDTAGAIACVEPARYTVRRFDDGALRFELEEDPCQGRRTTMTLVEWAGMDALGEAEANIQKGTAGPDDYLIRGRIRLIRGDLEGATRDLDQALILDSTKSRAYAARAALHLMKEHDFKRALADFDRAVEADPDDGLRYFQRAFVKFHSGDLEGACGDLVEAIQWGLPVEDKYETNCSGSR